MPKRVIILMTRLLSKDLAVFAAQQIPIILKRSWYHAKPITICNMQAHTHLHIVLHYPTNIPFHEHNYNLKQQTVVKNDKFLNQLHLLWSSRIYIIPRQSFLSYCNTYLKIWVICVFFGSIFSSIHKCLKQSYTSDKSLQQHSQVEK